MALSTIEQNNKLIKFRTEINREYVRDNMFSPYMGNSINSIIRRIFDNRTGGEQVNIPLVNRLTGAATGSGTLTGNEEAIDNYGMRAWIDWARHAVTTNDAEEQKDSADVFGEARPLLSDWGKELHRDEIIMAMQSLLSESPPVGLGSAAGQRVNGILYQDGTSAQMDTWAVDNLDRVLYGNLLSNYSGGHILDLAKITTTDTFLKSSVSLLKRIAKQANPRIRPYKTRDGYEYFVGFCGTYSFRDLKASLEDDHQTARPRSKDNIIFQDGDLVYDGVIIREVPEIDSFVDDVWNAGDSDLATGGLAGARVAPVYFCGQSAVGMPWGRMATPTQRDERDYQFITGVGVKMAYGVAKIFKKVTATSDLRQWGMVNGFFASSGDS